MEMPKAKQSEDGRKKMQHLMWLAQERPDGTYDLSSCDAYEIPSGVFSMCKVLRKEVLLFHTNHLSSLSTNGNKLADLVAVTELDIHGNDIAALPEEIGLLVQLKVLNIAQNKLKSLPSSLVKLKALRTLVLTGNKLVALPSDVHQLTALCILNADHNAIKRLPVALCHLSSTLATLCLDDAAMTYPPAAVCQQGTEAVMRYLCSDAGCSYVSPTGGCNGVVAVTNTSARQDASPPSHLQSPMDDTHRLYEATRERRRLEMVEHERQQAEEQHILASLLAESTTRGRSMAASVAAEAAAVDNSLLLLQNKKEAERLKLLAELQAEERSSSQLVAYILTTNEKMKNYQGILEQMESERLTHERMFAIKAGELLALRKHDLYDWMGAALLDNTEFDLALRRLADSRQDAVRRALEMEEESNSKLTSVLSMTAQEKLELARDLMTEEKWQMEAVEMLLAERDEKTQRIAHEIEMVEQELAKVTMLELRNRREHNGVRLMVLNDQRLALAELLERLLEERAARRKEVARWLHEMELDRERDQADFWLAQLQRLLDRKPAEVAQEEAKVDVNVLAVLQAAGALCYVPLFAKAGVTTFGMLKRALASGSLGKIGVDDEGTRARIEENVAGYDKLQYQDASELSYATCHREEVEASAPPATTPPEADVTVHSTLSLSMVSLHLLKECVICMDKEASIIFLPCGHACACPPCSVLVDSCPMCRGNITQRLPFTS